MATYLTIPIQNSPTVAVLAAAEIEDVRGKAIAFDADGKGVLATDPSKAVLGIAILASGDQNRLDGKDGYVADGGRKWLFCHSGRRQLRSRDGVKARGSKHICVCASDKVWLRARRIDLFCGCCRPRHQDRRNHDRRQQTIRRQI